MIYRGIVVIIQAIVWWAFIGALLFIGGNTPEFFKDKWWAIVAHGPLVWYVVFTAKITGQLNTEDPKSKNKKREG